jgi:hypothetical protein
MDSSAGDERILRFLIGSDKDETNSRVQVPFIVEPVVLTVKKPFISGSISVDGKSSKNISVAGGRELSGVINWQNNLPETVYDLEFILSFDGAPLDPTSITAQNGFYQSKDKSIIWTKTDEPTLARVAPGDSGTLSFTFGTLPPGSGGVLYTNPAVNLSLAIRGTRQGEGDVPQNVFSAASTQVTIASDITLEAGASHFSGLFSNSGPMPPRVDQETSYTITWTVRNSSNAVANAAVAAVLPPYIEFISAVPNSGVSYDQTSRTVRWSLGDVAAGAGYSQSARTASFQVVLTPSLSQVGAAPTLTGSAVLTGQDRFAQIPIEARASAPTIELTGDSQYNSSMGKVQDN